MLDVCLLGTGGMIPQEDRYLASMIARYNGKSILFDCGEGTQVSLQNTNISFKSIDIICLTHYHCDHISGLPGLLLTMGNMGRTEKITLVGLKGLQKIVKGLLLIAPQLAFDIEYKELEFNKINEFKIGEFNLKSFPLEHGIDCLGYTLEIKRNPKFSAQKARELNIPVNYWKNLQNGEEIIIDDKKYTFDMVSDGARKGLKISYCTDSRPIESIIENIKNSDLFICEGMYGAEEDAEKASKHFHMTFQEAAYLAKKSEVEELWLTHFSPAMKDMENYLENTKKIFDNTYIGKDKMIKILKFKD